MPRRLISTFDNRRGTSQDSVIRTSEFVISIERQRFYGRWRHYWTICSLRKPDELVCWGFASTRVLAEIDAAAALTNSKP
jgi:hypothetical protein